MRRFLGRFDYSVDLKGRVNVPAKFRKALSPEAEETFIIFRVPGGCLRAYPADCWEEVEKKLESAPETPESSLLKRRIYDTVTESTLDSQGRITLTPPQITLAKIKKNVTLVGQSKFIEIWDTAKYDEYLGTDENFDQDFYKHIDGAIE